MTIEPKEFLDLYLAVMAENEISCINIMDIVEVIKIIYSSDEFKTLRNKLHIEKLDTETILEHDFTTKLDENGILEFNVTEEEKEKILIKDINDTNALQSAINKRAIAGMLELSSEGKIKFQYDDPDGTYNLQHVLSDPLSEGETKIYTDGIIEEIPNKNHKELYTTTRDVKVTNSTYTILVDCFRNEPIGVEVRGISQGDYLMIATEAERLLEGHNEGYNEIKKDKPRTYKHTIH